MPSDPLDAVILGHLRRPVDRFRSALALAAEQLRGRLDAVPCRDTDNGRDELRDMRDLGAFAAGRINAERFEALLTRRSPPSTATPDGELLQRAWQQLSELLDRGDELLVLRIERGTSVVAAVERGLAEIGLAFGAARLVAPDTPASERDPTLLAGLPFGRWNRAERDLAPPLVLHIDGADLFADGLARLLDGGVKVVLCVRDDCSPAPLVRLVTPQTFVLQTRDADALRQLARWPGAGVAALVPDSAACFVHDPAAGATLAERLTITSVPEHPPAAALGSRSRAQQEEELRQLATLAQVQSPLPAGAAGDDRAHDPVDALAAWLLGRADLSDLRTP